MYNINGKSRKSVERELMRLGYTEFIYDDEERILYAGLNASGVCVKNCTVKFSNKERAIECFVKKW